MQPRRPPFRSTHGGPGISPSVVSNPALQRGTEVRGMFPLRRYCTPRRDMRSRHEIFSTLHPLPLSQKTKGIEANGTSIRLEPSTEQMACAASTPTIRSNREPWALTGMTNLVPPRSKQRVIAASIPAASATAFTPHGRAKPLSGELSSFTGHQAHKFTYLSYFYGEVLRRLRAQHCAISPMQPFSRFFPE